MSDRTSTQRVNRAIHIAVAKILESKVDVQDRHSLGQSVGKRLSGTYGASLRQMADAHPSATAEEMFAAVIAPEEFPWDTEAEAIRNQFNAGMRDRARKANYGPYAEDRPVATSLAEHIAELRMANNLGAEDFKARDRRPPEPVERELVFVPPSVRQALDAGKTIGAENRKARKERAMSEGAR